MSPSPNPIGDSGQRLPIIVVHGGAYTVADEYAAQNIFLRQLVRHIGSSLRLGMSSLDAVCEAVQEMEDSGLFLAGRGSAPNAEGVVELDASLMDGAERRAGAVAAVPNLKNPIRGARAVMERTPHVLLVGAGAATFLDTVGVRRVAVPSSYFRSPEKYAGAPPAASTVQHGTVGAVALDADGKLAAATSTGGMVGKMPGRVSDSAIIGAATYADLDIAISSTGHGEHFIRRAAAHEVASRVRYGGFTIDAAVESVIEHELAADGAWGGMIALGRNGDFSVRFNCAGIHAAFARAGEIP